MLLVGCLRSAAESRHRCMPQPPNPMNIRRFHPGEEPKLFNIFHSAIHLIASRDYTDEQVHAWAPSSLDAELWARRMRGINPFVAELDGELVGYADVQSDGYIDHFFVSGHHPRQGIGRALMEALEAEAASLGLQELTSDVSVTAQPFFEHFGFLVVEHQSPVIDGVEMLNARMRKLFRADF
jgi:putative acetyltransferase